MPSALTHLFWPESESADAKEANKIMASKTKQLGKRFALITGKIMAFDLNKHIYNSDKSLENKNLPKIAE